jgi:DOPA 4,5-dioxygenase
MSEIENFHAHVYYDAPTRAQALKLCEAAGQKFGVKVGRMHDNPVGPHPRGSVQLTVLPEQFGEFAQWAAINRRGRTQTLLVCHCERRRSSLSGCHP